MRLDRRFAAAPLSVSVLSAVTLLLLCLLPASAHAQTTALFYDSQPGEFVGSGSQGTGLPANGVVFQASVSLDNKISVTTRDASSSFRWDLSFRNANSAPLQTGHYYGATDEFLKNVSMEVSGNGHGCNTVTGRYWVREIVMSGTTVQKLAIDFEQHCEDNNPGLFGALRFNSDISSLIPFEGDYPRYRLEVAPTLNGAVTGTNLDCEGAGPACAVEYGQPQSALAIAAAPDPGFYFSGWSGSCQGGLHSTVHLNTIEHCGALFTPFISVEPRVLMLNSHAGDFIGQGKRQILNNSNASWIDIITTLNGQPQSLAITAQAIGGGIDVSSVRVAIAAPIGTTLVPGTYQAAGFGSASFANLDVSSDSRGCNQSRSGTFTLYEIQITGSTIAKLALDFEQHCTGVGTPPQPLVGSLRINSTIPPRPSLALVVGAGGSVQLTPTGQTCTTNCSPMFAPGTLVTMTPVPAVGYSFAGWQGDADCADGAVLMVGPMACQAQFVNQLTADLVTPASGFGISQTFTLDFSSTNGGNDINTAWVWFTPTFSGSAANSCLLYYQRSGPPRFFLLDDAGTTWQSALAGLPGTLQNSRCAIDALTSGATVTGNTLHVTLNISFRAPASGFRKIFMYAANLAGGNTQWQEKGSWTVPTPSITPNVSPISGAGPRQTFTLTYADTFGAGDLTQGWVWFTQSFGGSSANSCLAYYERSTNRLALLNDAGTAWSFATLGSATPLQNSRCALSPSTSTATVNSTSLAVNLTVTFLAPYAGTKQIWVYGTNGTQSSGWQNRGTWTAQAPLLTSGAPTPGSGTGATQLFSLPYSSNLGATDITKAWVWFNATLASSATGSCLVYYERPTNTLFLLNDAGTQWQPAAIGTAATLENGQCAIAVGSSTATLAGDVLTLQLAMTFKPVFAGSKNIYMYTEGASGVSGWLDRGDWTVPAPPPPVTADAAIPNAGNTASQTFALTYSSTSGAGSLTAAWVWFNATIAQTAAASCLAYYEPGSGLVSLLNDAGTVWQSASMGGATTLQNSQCAIDLADSQAVPSGNTLTLSLAVTFKPAFAGDKNIYLYASTGTANSGWQDRGDWTVPAVVAAVGVTPNSGSNGSATFALTYASVNGASDLKTAWVWFNATLAQSAAASCLVYYDQPAHALFLLNDTGTIWQSASVGVAGTLQNSQCSIDMGVVSIVPNGTTLTIDLPITFVTPAFAGAKNIYMYAANAQSASGWQDRGDWTVP